MYCYCNLNDWKIKCNERKGESKLSNYLKFKYCQIVYCFLHLEEYICKILLLTIINNENNNLIYLQQKFKNNIYLKSIINELNVNNNQNNNNNLHLYVTEKQVKYIFNNYKWLFKEKIEKWKTNKELIDFIYIFDEIIYFKNLLKYGLMNNENLLDLQNKLEKLYLIFSIVCKKILFPNGINGLSNEKFENLHKIIWNIIEKSIQKGFNFNEYWYYLFEDIPENFNFNFNPLNNEFLTDLFIIDCYFDKYILKKENENENNNSE
ncbi:hypothetical protein ABK040_004596 [Willaertia magna]